MTGPAPAISVVVPTYRRPELLAQCLEALATQTADAASFDINVVDDHSADDTATILADAAQSMPNLNWTSQPDNRGPAAARNRGVALGAGRLLLFIDDDIVASPDLVETHLGQHQGRDDWHGVVGRVAWLPGLKVTPFMAWAEQHAMFNFHNMTAGSQDNVPSALYTCNLSISRTAFDAVGGFDERFPFPACEDTDLGVRLAERGFDLWFVPEALAWHAREVTLPDLRSRMRQTAPSKELFAQLHPDAFGPAVTERRLRPDTPPWRVIRAAKRWSLRAASRITPRVGRYDVRALHYNCELGQAHLAGLRDQRRRSAA